MLGTLVAIESIKIQVLNVHRHPIHVVISTNTIVAKFDLKLKTVNELPQQLEDRVKTFFPDLKLNASLSLTLLRQGSIKFSNEDGVWGNDLELIYIK